MPQQVTEIDALRMYLQGVVGRADHHAQNVNQIFLAIAGAVIWRKDDNPLEVFTRSGEMKNVLWFEVNRIRYVLSYNHKTENIELRKGSTRGAVVGSFSNVSTNEQVRDVFSSL